MPRITFLPSNVVAEVDEGTKVLVAARKAKVPIEFGCASCRCGTCGIEVSGRLKAPKANEIELLEKMSLSTSGNIRLACQTRIGSEDITVDIGFHGKYNPDTGMD